MLYMLNGKVLAFNVPQKPTDLLWKKENELRSFSFKAEIAVPLKSISKHCCLTFLGNSFYVR